MVGILRLFVICFAALGVMHSKTIENAPAFSINFASFNSFLVLSIVSPSTLNFLNCEVKPM